MLRSVLLRHDLPDGTWHFDWLIDAVGVGGPDDRNLVTFRVAQRPDDAAGPFEAKRLPDHRRLYLTFEGPLQGLPRGSVHRVAEWPCRVITAPAGELHVELETSEGPRRLRGRHTGEATGEQGEPWRFEFSSP